MFFDEGRFIFYIFYMNIEYLSSEMQIADEHEQFVSAMSGSGDQVDDLL